MRSNIHLLKNSLAPVVLDDLVFNMDFVSVPLPDREESVLSSRYSSLLDPVVACDVPRIDSREVGRLDAARSDVAAVEDAVAIRPGDEISTPGLQSAVAVAKVRLALSEEFIR